MENEEVVPQSKSGGLLSSMSTKQKLIGGGILAAVGLGLYAARKGGGMEAQSSYMPSQEEELIPWMPSGSSDTGSGSTAPPVIVPDVPPIDLTPYVSILTPEQYTGRTGSSVSGATSTIFEPGLGNGGIDYGSASKTDKAAMASDFGALHSDPFYRSAEQVRAETVYANREAAGLSTADQSKYLRTIDAINSGESFLNNGKTSTKSVAANGGANYATADKATQQKLVSSEQLLKSGSKADLLKEQARVSSVIAGGGDTAAAQKHAARVAAALKAAK